MTDTKLLRDQVDKSGLKYQFIAENLDLSRFGLSMKVDDKTEFKASEIIKLCDLLNIDNDLRDRIFFTP